MSSIVWSSLGFGVDDDDDDDDDDESDLVCPTVPQGHDISGICVPTWTSGGLGDSDDDADAHDSASFVVVPVPQQPAAADARPSASLGAGSSASLGAVPAVPQCIVISQPSSDTSAELASSSSRSHRLTLPSSDADTPLCILVSVADGSLALVGR